MQTETIDYQHQDKTFEGFVAHDVPAGQQRPLVLIAHAWGGRDDFVCQKAQELAKLGYIGFAMDVYGKGVLGGSKEENTDLMLPLVEDRATLLARLNAALECAKALPQVDTQKLAVMGYCFGGLCALDMVRGGAEIKGAVSFHGILTAPEGVKNSAIKAKVLALHGHDDPMVPPEQVLAFAKEMTAAGVDWQLHAYGGVMHAFTNPEAADLDFGTVYNECADQRSWQATCNFFNELFA